MLDKAHIHQIYEVTEKQGKEIKQLVEDINHDIKYDFKTKITRVISKQKDSYLKEILDNLQSGSPLEQKYTASDMLNVLETVFDELKLDEIEEYDYEKYHFDCQNCKNIISSDDFPNLTKEDFNYCPHCGKPIEK